MLETSFSQVGVNFALSMLTGLVIGAERAINNRTDGKKTGIRDFTLVAILAFISSLFYKETPMAWIVSFVSVILFALAAFVLESMRHMPKPTGMTTLLSLPVTFLVASLPNFNTHFWIIATIVFVLLLILDLKEHFQLFVDGLDRREMVDFAVLIGIAISITPLIPAGSKLPVPLVDLVDGAVKMSYRYIGLESLWKVVIMVSLMSFVAHFITKYIRGKNALLLATFFGGLVSSLATIMMLLRNDSAGEKAKIGEGEGSAVISKAGGGLSNREIFLGYVAANTGSIVKDAVILRTVVGEEMFAKFLFPMISALVLFAAISAYAFSSQGEMGEVKITKRPLPLNFIFKFSMMLAVLLIIMQMVTYYMGSGAIVIASFLSGCASSAAAITAIGSAMTQHGGIGGWVAGLSVIAALLGSISAKYLVIAKRMGVRQSLPFMLPITTLALVMLVTMWISLTPLS